MSTSTLSAPPLNTFYPISREQHEQYQRNGFIILRGVLSTDEVAAWRALLNEKVREDIARSKPMAQRDTYGKAFLQIMHLWERFPEVRPLSLSRRLGKIVADLMGVEGVRIMQDQVLYKEAGGGYTPWHQDQYYMPFDNDHVATLWMALVDVTRDMGTMSYVPGAHKKGPLFDAPTSDNSDIHFQNLINENGWEIVPVGNVKAGDVCIHTGWCPHNAGANTTSTMREVFNEVYYQDGSRIVARGAWEGASLGHLGKRQPGELADSEMNPVIYSRS